MSYTSYNYDEAREVRFYEDGTILYLKNGLPHRDGDLPAEIRPDGYQAWYKNGESFREGNKPDIINNNSLDNSYEKGRVRTYVINGNRATSITNNGSGYISPVSFDVSVDLNRIKFKL